MGTQLLDLLPQFNDCFDPPQTRDNSSRMMLTVTVLALVAATCHAHIGFGGCPTVPTQATVDVEKYMGTWIEVYAFPTQFEKGKCTRATYTLKDDGHIKVYNRGVLHDGTVDDITGDAYRPHADEQGKLLVRFAAGTPYGSYWVIDTDYTGTSLVYSCTSLGVAHYEQAWILARNSTIDDVTKDKLMAELAGYGVDVSYFKKTDQTDCPDLPPK